ncbi:transposase [Methylobacterium dankookense]|uniref:transposase n=1 Tax=Methylobacterium dankookense TaxID=560405 RepID=UPI003570A0C1
MRVLARHQRRRCGRRPDPRLVIIDTRSVPCIGVRGPRGYDGAKKLVGRKRVALVDAEGHVLALAVVPANVQDRDTLPALDDGKEPWPSLRLAIRDGAFTAGRCQEWCNLHGMRHRVVEKGPDQRGFVALERRWLVERTLGWLSHGGGLLRERAGRLDVATGRLACVASLMAANALNNPA